MLLSIANKVLSCFRSSGVTKAEALEIARKHNLEAEVIEAMRHGCTPEEALEEWDIPTWKEKI